MVQDDRRPARGSGPGPSHTNRAVRLRVHLLSGGKDSTYALYRLVELGFDLFALTLDNGYISEQAKENVRRTVAELGVEPTVRDQRPHGRDLPRQPRAVFERLPGCYKTIYRSGRHVERSSACRCVITGLSRGQLFETRLMPAAVHGRSVRPRRNRSCGARSAPGIPSGTRWSEPFARHDSIVTDDVFDRLTYVDFYRYVDVELSEMLDYPRDPGALGPPDRHGPVDELPDRRGRNLHPSVRAGIPQLRRPVRVGCAPRSQDAS